MDILYPPDSCVSTATQVEDLNNTSIVMKISYGNTSFLLPADLEEEGEQKLLSMNHLLKCDVLLSPHHGSSSSSTPAFLAAVDPEVVVISAGHSNWWGFPHHEVLGRYKDMGFQVYRTDLHGAVTVVSDGTAVTVKSHEQSY